ncbi:MAG: GHMP kinase, partial [Promethearchaeota archaeon]
MSKEQLFQDYQDYQEIMKHLSQNKYIFQFFPDSIPAVHDSGEAFSIAYPIQGLLKYHGMVDKDLRIAYFPSISLNNDSVETITYIKFDHQFNEDRVILNGKEISKQSREYLRISYQLDKIRAFASVSTYALIISRNVKTKSGIIAKGKGLGTSASGGAAITRAALQILYSGREDIIKNPQLNSYLSRFLAGSASRSSVGGIGLWLNHPKISSKDSIAIRLDRKDDQNFIKSIDLITVSLESPIKTEQIHELAPRSPFFNNWLEGRKEKIIEIIDALQTHNLEKLGELTEFDTMALHAVTMTADPKENLV